MLVESVEPCSWIREDDPVSLEDLCGDETAMQTEERVMASGRVRVAAGQEGWMVLALQSELRTRRAFLSDHHHHEG